MKLHEAYTRPVFPVVLLSTILINIHIQDGVGVILSKKENALIGVQHVQNVVDQIIGLAYVLAT